MAQSLSPEEMVQAQAAQSQGGIVDIAKGAGKFLLNSGNALISIPQEFGMHLGTLAAEGTGILAGKLGFQGEADKIAKNLQNQRTTTYTGGTYHPLKIGDLAGASKQIFGDAVSTGSLLYTPAKVGIGGLATLGALSATGQSLSSGKDLTSKATIDSAKEGAIFGGILGLLGNAARQVVKVQKAGTGVDAATQADLAATRPATLSKVIETAIDSNKSHHAPTVSDWLNNELKSGATILDKKVIPQAGKDIELAKKESANLPVSLEGGTTKGEEAVKTIVDQVNDIVQKYTGHQFNWYATGEDSGLTILNYKGSPATGITGPEGGLISQLPGRATELSPSESKMLNWLGGQFVKLVETPNVQTAADIVSNIDKNIDWEKVTKFGSHSSPVDSILQQARGMLNHGLIRPSAPKLATANDFFSNLMEVKNSLVQGAGNDLQHLDLLGRRTLYNGQSGQAQSILDSLFNAVKPHLPPGEESYATKAILARYARDVYGGVRSRSGLAQGVTAGEASSAITGVNTRMMFEAALKAGARLVAPDAREYAMSISKGEPYSFVPFMHHIDKWLDTPEGNKMLQSVKDALKKAGVSSNNVSEAGVQTLKAMVLNNLVKPQASPMTPAEMLQAQQGQQKNPSLSF